MKKPEVELWLEVETRCNLQCKFCFNYWKDGSAQAPTSVPTAQYLEALRRLFAVVHCPKVTISGGEPTLRPDLANIVAFLAQEGASVVITTNGLLLTKEMIRELRLAGATTFEIPLHSASPMSHNFLAGAGTWEGALETLVMLQGLQIPVVPVFVATERNVSEFSKVVEMCALLGLQEIIFNRFVPTGLGILHRDSLGVPSDRLLRDILVQANPIARNRGISIHLGMPIDLESIQPLSQVQSASCPVNAGQTRWTIDASCNIRRCNQSASSIGNLLGDGALRIVESAIAGGISKAQYRPCQILSSASEQLISIRNSSFPDGASPTD